MTTKCNVCGEEKDTRLGACFDCAEAEEIIHSGFDMYDKGPDGDEEIPALTAMEKLKFLIQKGWRYEKVQNIT